MDGRPDPVRVALVDLDWRGIDMFRSALAVVLREPRAAAEADVRLVVADGPESASFLWARLAGVPRAGEVARLGEVVVDAIVVSAASPRASQAARLAAALGALVVALPASHVASQQAGATS